ncbi:MAG: restriction endonuclease subunit S [Ktedonobacteraceae bacterium]
MNDDYQHWRQIKWGDLATLEYGKGLRGYQNTDGRYPVYGTNGLIGWHETSLCDKPGIIIGRKGAYRGVHLSKTPFFVIDTAFYLKLLTNDVDLTWAYYQLLNFDINKIDSGSAIPSTSRDAFYQIPVLLPPLLTQRKIATILSAYDDLIENNTRRTSILEEMAQSLYREWFVHFRFPGHEKKSLVETALGMIPEGWEVRTFGEVIELAYGKALKADMRVVGNILVYGSGGVIGYHNEGIVKGPGIIVGRKGNVGSVFWSDNDFFPIDTVFFVRSNVCLHYIYYNLQDQHFVNNDAAVPGLNRNQAYLLPFLLPDGPILSIFQEFIDPLFRQKQVLIKKNANLRQTRDLLLPKLISGEVDVEGLDICIEGEKND